MPGKVIGTTLNAQSEPVWHGQIEITKSGQRHRYGIQAERSRSEIAAKFIREQLDRLMLKLDRSSGDPSDL